MTLYNAAGCHCFDIYNDVIIYSVYAHFLIFELMLWLYIPVSKFCCDKLTNNEDNGGRAHQLPQTYGCKKKPSPIKVNKNSRLRNLLGNHNPDTLKSP